MDCFFFTALSGGAKRGLRRKQGEKLSTLPAFPRLCYSKFQSTHKNARGKGYWWLCRLIEKRKFDAQRKNFYNILAMNYTLTSLSCELCAYLNLRTKCQCIRIPSTLVDAQVVWRKNQTRHWFDLQVLVLVLSWGRKASLLLYVS